MSFNAIYMYIAHTFRWAMHTHTFPGWLLLNAHQKLKVLAGVTDTVNFSTFVINLARLNPTNCS